MTAIRAMLFDLDGTLLDSAPDLVASLNHVRASEKLPPLPLEKMRMFASKGALGLLKAGMPASGDTILEARRQLFLAHYAQNSYRESALFDGIPELLEFLAQAGIAWGIVTNKPEALTLPIVEAARLSGSVGCVVCGDTLSERKPHPAPVSLACGIVNAAPADTVFVGDDVRDIQAGKAAGTRTAAVYYGYGSHELEGDCVDGSYRIHHPSDLIALIEASDGSRNR
jgi:phosphoglycolate phosphatase